jgi:hypothetical protein
VEYVGGRMAGHLFIGGCTTPDRITDVAKARATAFAAAVGEKAVAHGSHGG